MENKLLKLSYKKVLAIYGHQMKELMHPILGLNITQFEETFYPNIPDGKSLKDAIIEDKGIDVAGWLEDIL